MWKVGQKYPFCQMSAILKFDFQKREQLRFSEVNDLNYTKKGPTLHVATTFSVKQGETRTSHGPIPHPLKWLNLSPSCAMAAPMSRKLIYKFS